MVKSKTVKFLEIYVTDFIKKSNSAYLSRHPEFKRIEFPKTFYFRYLPDRRAIHWAIIKKINEADNNDKRVNIYFINDWGRVFDKLEFKNIKIARRRLRKNGFDFSTNRYCPYIPPKPVYINLSSGKNSAPYSKGNLWTKVYRGKQNNKKAQTFHNQNIKRFVNYMNDSETDNGFFEKFYPAYHSENSNAGCVTSFIGMIMAVVIPFVILWLLMFTYVQIIDH